MGTYKRKLFLLFFVVNLFFFVGCTEVQPEVDLLSSQFSSLLFSDNSSTYASKTVTPVNGDVNVWTGEEIVPMVCDEHGETFEIRFSENEEWQKLNDSQIKCIDGKAQLRLSPTLLGTGGLNKLSGITNGNNKLTIYLRNSITLKNKLLSFGTAKMDLFFNLNGSAPSLIVNTPATNYINSVNVTGFAVSGTCSENGSNVILSGPITGTGICNSGIWSMSVDLSSLSEGTVTLLFNHMNTSGIQASQQQLNLTKDTVAPTASIAGYPTGVNNVTNLNVSVSGTDVVNYKYKVGPSSSTICTLYDASYTSEISQATSITDSLAGIADGAMRLCVLAVDAAGNVQSAATSTEVNWTKDSSSPTTILSSLPSNPSNLTTLAISVGGTDIQSYKYKLGSSVNTDCSVANGYGAETAASSNISENIASYSDGNLKICVIGKNSLGTWQTESNATSFTWHKDTQASVDISTSASTVISSANQYSFSLSGGCSDSGESIAVSVNSSVSGTVICSSGSWNTDINLSSQSDGSIPITVSYQDAAGNSASSGPVNFTKDTIGPTVGIGSLAPDTGNSTATFSASVFYAADASSIHLTSADIDLSGTGFTCSTVSVTNGTTTNPTVNVSGCTGNGTLTVSVKSGTAEDINSNPAVASGSTTVTIDNTAPLDPTLSISSSAGSTMPTVTVSGVASGDNVHLYANDSCSTRISNNVSASGVTVNVSPTTLGLGNNTIYAKVTDSAGNFICSSGSVVYDYFALVNVDPAYPSSGANWNDYVNNNGADVFSANDTSCNDIGTGPYFEKCIHGGEKKKVIVSGISSCSNLVITDDLDTFEWICKDSSGTATFYTKGLKPNKGLRDLIGSSGSWTNNFVTVTQNNVTVALSAGSAWWANAIESLPNNSSGASIATLNSEGKIYYINADRPSFGYQIAADKVSIVTLGNTLLKHQDSGSTNLNCNTSDGTAINPTIVAMFCGGTRKHIWVEANIDGSIASTNKADSGIFAYKWIFSRIHNSTISPLDPASVQYSINLKNSQSNFVSNVSVYKVSNGIRLESNSEFNRFNDIKIAQAKMYGGFIMLDSTSGKNRFYSMRLSDLSYASGTPYGIHIASSQNIFADAVISNINGGIGSEGIYLAGSAGNNILSSIIVSGTTDAAIKIEGADNNIISHFTAANSIWNGIFFAGTNTDSNVINSAALINFSKPVESDSAVTGIGNFLINSALRSHTSTALTVDSTSSAFLEIAGYLIKPSAQSVSGTGIANTSFYSPISNGLMDALSGKASADSVISAPTMLYTNISGSLWIDLENLFRTWGVDGSIFPSTSNEGYCGGSSTCRIWDWRVKAGAALANTSVGGTLASNAAFPTVTGNCPQAYDGDANDTITANGFTFMKNAVENNNDTIGNNNGLCESNEDCIYAPNVGAYQGEGTLSSNYCTTVESAVNNARLFTYSTTAN